MCRSIGRICTQKGPDGAFDSSLAVYDFLYLNVFFCNFFCIYRCLVQGHTTALGPSWLLKQAAQPWGRSCKELWKNTLIDWSRQVKLLDALRTMTKKILYSKSRGLSIFSHCFTWLLSQIRQKNLQMFLFNELLQRILALKN